MLKTENGEDFSYLCQANEILESISGGLYALDRNWCFIYINQHMCSLLGVQTENIIGQNIWQKFPQMIGTACETNYRTVMETGQPRQFEQRGILIDHWWSVRVNPARNGILVHFQDITEHKLYRESLVQDRNELEQRVNERTEQLRKVFSKIKQSQKALKEANRQLKHFGQRITQAQELERKRIAYELHDDTAQYLSIIKMQLNKLINSGEIQSSEVMDKLKYMEKDASRALVDVRRYSHELRPVILEQQGLGSALEQMAEDYNRLETLSVKVFVEGLEPDLTEEVKLGFFRIAQEALNNVRKHAKATESDIHIRFTQKHVRMMISDNGVGFNTREALKRSTRQGSLGLLSMQERAELINADLDIESETGKGCRVILRAKI